MTLHKTRKNFEKMDKNNVQKWDRRNTFGKKRAALGNLRNFFGASCVTPYMVSAHFKCRVLPKSPSGEMHHRAPKMHHRAPKMHHRAPKMHHSPPCLCGCAQNAHLSFPEKGFPVFGTSDKTQWARKALDVISKYVWKMKKLKVFWKWWLHNQRYPLPDIIPKNNDYDWT